MSETQVLFVGGPSHGRRATVQTNPDGCLPLVVLAQWPQQSITIADVASTTGTLRGPATYNLRRYSYVDGDGACSEYAYVCGDGELYGQGGRGAELRDVRLADHLLAELERLALPFCIAPGCDSVAPMLFVAAESGRLGGRDWQPGDQIRLCSRHAQDVYAAQGVYGREQLAEWLRPDAKLDALDAFDAAYDSLYGQAIAERRARMLRLKVQAQA